MSSCKKNDNKDPKSSDIPAGQCSISFNTDKDFGGSTAINIGPNVASIAQRTEQNNKTMMSLSANSANPMDLKTALLSIYVPQGATTDNGGLSGNFDGSSSDPVNITLLIGAGTTNNQSFLLTSGSLTVTKLSTTQVEGTFSGTGENQSDNTTMAISNGKFAAKFK